jgi:hypothetical protein
VAASAATAAAAATEQRKDRARYTAHRAAVAGGPPSRHNLAKGPG